MPTATVSRKGWIVIPKEIREKYGIKPGDKVQIVEYGGIHILPVAKDPAKEMRGMFKGGPSMAEDLRAERRRELEHEERNVERRGGKHLP